MNDVKCPVCGKIKSTKMDLARHMRQSVYKEEEHLGWLKESLGETKSFKPIAEKLNEYFR